MNDLFDSEFWATGITQFVVFLLVIVVIVACVKGWAVWQDRFRSGSKRPPNDDQ